jgi:hypothetical protein
VASNQIVAIGVGACVVENGADRGETVFGRGS